MASKRVADRQKLALLVLAAADTHAERVARRLEASLAPALKSGEVMPDVGLLIHLAARQLGEAQGEMVRADEAHEQELADDDAWRATRDAAAEALSDEVIDFRDVLTALYGPAAATRFGLSGETPRDPMQLQQLTGQVLQTARTTPLPAPRFSGATVDLPAWVAKLQGEHQTLADALGHVARELREAEGTLIDKNARIERFDQRYVDAATLLSALLSVAGEKELAERVRPRRVNRAGEVEVEAGAPVEAGTGGEVTSG